MQLETAKAIANFNIEIAKYIVNGKYDDQKDCYTLDGIEFSTHLILDVQEMFSFKNCINGQYENASFEKSDDGFIFNVDRVIKSLDTGIESAILRFTCHKSKSKKTMIFNKTCVNA